VKNTNRPISARQIPDLDVFAAHARDDCDGFQAVALDHGPARVLLQMEWDSRAEAQGRARWAFGYDAAAVGHMGGPAGRSRFIITDYFERVREDGHVGIWHADFIAGAEDVRHVEFDLSAEGLTGAFSQWQIHARDFLSLQAAFALLAESGGTDGTGASRAHDLRAVAAQAVISAIHAKWGVGTPTPRDDRRDLRGRVVA
jgi:hypothetical protein